MKTKLFWTTLVLFEMHSLKTRAQITYAIYLGKSNLKTGSEFGNKNSFAKKKNKHREENKPPQAKKCFGFCEAF